MTKGKFTLAKITNTDTMFSVSEVDELIADAKRDVFIDVLDALGDPVTAAEVDALPTRIGHDVATVLVLINRISALAAKVKP